MEKADLYKEKFLNMISNLKKDIGRPDIPVYAGGLGDYLEQCALDPHLKNYRQINEILESLAKENSDIMFVSAEGLKSKEDFLHFDTASLREFGKRFFASYTENNPELTRQCVKQCDNIPEISSVKMLELMKIKLKNGSITEKEYDDFIKKHISQL